MIAGKNINVKKNKSYDYNLIVFDIETESLNDYFKHAKSKKDRLKYAPKPKLCCVYIKDIDSYKYFIPKNFKKLCKLLQNAKTVISYNGKNFDELVLKKHYKFKGMNGNHIDMCKIISNKAGYLVSLDKASILNLNEKKKIKGKDMPNLKNIKEIKEGCKSDVSQTYRLYELYKSRKLKIPPKGDYKFNLYNHELDEDEYQDNNLIKSLRRLSAEQLEEYFLERAKENELEAEYLENATEGQAADYLASGKSISNYLGMYTNIEYKTNKRVNMKNKKKKKLQIK